MRSRAAEDCCPFGLMCACAWMCVCVFACVCAKEAFSFGLHKSVYLYKGTRTSQKKRRGARFRSPKRRPRLSKVYISLKASFKNQRYTDIGFKVG